MSAESSRAASGLTSLFRPNSVAIIGASETGGEGFAKRIFQNLVAEKAPVKIHLINPRRTELWGQHVFPDLKSVPESIDLALILIPAEHIETTFSEAAEVGVKAAIIYASRFGEGADEKGKSRGDFLRSIADNNGVRICGPNCLGVLSIRERIINYPSADVRALPPGHVGVAFQSGGTFRYWMLQAAERGLGFSYAVSTGNELDLDLADYIDFMVDDEETRVIACLSEGIRRPQAFFKAARRALAARKPIVLLKTGRTEAGRASALSHVGAISGDDDVFDAVCRKYGIVRCSTLDDMIETCLAFQPQRLPRGNRIAVSGFSGGGRGLILDYSEATSLQFSQFSADTIAAVQPKIDPGLVVVNPLDSGAGLAVRQDDFCLVSQALAADPDVDVLLVQGRLPVRHDEKLDASHFAAVAASTDKPVFAYDRMTQNVTEVSRSFQKSAQMPFLQRLPETLRAVDALTKYASVTRKPLPADTEAPQGGEAVTAQEFVNVAGIAVPWSRLCVSTQDVAKIAREHGKPVALKLVSAEAIHKTEVGGVRLNVQPEEAAAAAGAMIEQFKRLKPGAGIEGVLVQEMISGVEVIIGIREDPLYGPFLLMGLGGVFVEIVRDASRRMLPLAATDPAEMLNELKGARLLSGYRGSQAADTDALCDATMRLSKTFMLYRGRVSDVEINPILVLPKRQGVRAVDVRVIGA